MKGHKFPTSTRGVYIPGVGITLTRANIRTEQDRRVKNGGQLMEAEEVVATFCIAPFKSKTKRDEPYLESRLVHRASTLLNAMYS